MTLTKHQRQLAALAAAIHADLSQTRTAVPALAMPEISWQCCRHQLRLLELAQRRGYLTTAAKLHEEFRQMLSGLLAAIDQLRAQLPSVERHNLWPAGDIYRDLLGLSDEFPEVEWNKKQGILSVTTDPIELEGRYLGPFKIELHWRQRRSSVPYNVRALDPQPASRDSEVTHPHVQGEQLCEGEGTMAIRAALREGRLLDFFLVINNLLHTYNSSSPYIGLDEWEGVRCRECDYSMDEDDSRYCERCETTLCSECTRGCCDCGQTLCSSCSLTCPGCDDDVCRGCAKECRDCNQSFCSSCLQDDERRPTCHEQFQEQAESEVAGAALQSL